MRASDIAAMLARSAETWAAILLPNGKRQGHEWRCGGIGGEAGESLGVHLTGQKAGVWCDFASGESGDMLDLWAAVRGVSMGEAIRQAKAELGIADRKLPEPRREYKRPSKDGVSALLPQHAQWLREVRKIPDDVQARFKLASKKGALMFPYLRGGELVFAKYRKVPAKEFFIDAECEPSLFGWQALTGRERAVCLVEGELDALAMAAYGVPALSVPMGGGKGAKQQWIDSEFERLAQFDDIVLCLDSDEAGQQAADEIAKRLGRERCRMATLPRKDANDCLMAGIGYEEIHAAIKSAKTLDPEKLRKPLDFLDQVLAAFAERPGEARGIRLPWKKVGESLLLRPSEVSLWAGINGHGKSQVVGHIALSAMTQGHRACIASMELAPHLMLRRLVKQAGGTGTPTQGYVRAVAEWMQRDLWVFDTLGTARVPEMLEVFAYAAKRYGVELFVVDNLAKCGIAEDDYNGQKDLVDKLGDFAKAFGVHVMLVAHMRKAQDEAAIPGKFDVKGSGALTDMVDTVVSVWRNKPKEAIARKASVPGAAISEKDQERLESPDALLTCSKQRHGDDEPTISLWFDTSCYQYLAGPDHQPRPIARELDTFSHQGVA